MLIEQEQQSRKYTAYEHTPALTHTHGAEGWLKGMAATDSVSVSVARSIPKCSVQIVWLYASSFPAVYESRWMYLYTHSQAQLRLKFEL